MRSIICYSANNRIKRQDYWQRPFTFLADRFTGVKERHEADYFSQYFVEEMIKKHHFPMKATFPEVWTNSEAMGPETRKAGMEIKSGTDDARLSVEEMDFTREGNGLKMQLDINTLGNHLRARTGVQIYGAPAFDIKFLAYKSGRSKMTVTRKEQAYPLG